MSVLDQLQGVLAGLAGTEADQVAGSILARHEQASAEFARHRAAARMRQAVLPVGGRKEGLATAIPEHMVKDVVTLPQRAFGAVQQYEDTGEYNPGPIMEAASMMVGTPGVPSGAVGSSVGKGIRAYHGSPHDFERFDLSKIGTGEGAQAYGHGLYFAENPATAQAYRDSLSELKPRSVGETGLDVPSWVAKKVESRNPIAIADVRRDFQGRLAEERANIANSPQPWLIEGRIENMQNILRALDHIESGAPIAPAGRMYEVNINAHPDQFLDWDAPLAGQPAHPVIADLAKNLEVGKGFRERVASPDPALKGSEAYDELAHRMGLSWTGPIKSPQERKSLASAALQEAGIPGIKYLDQGSRGAIIPASQQHMYKPWGGELDVPKATSNYVVFNDKLIDILRKYGVAAPVAGSIAKELAAQSNDQ